ncbi:NAD+ synthase [Salidesulfovibrio onnuriiensis]|uniref:NAD+ synthase n=1 Tax=Salidesulfovibrio onnuriiensis TaxID=2583823 RepID=UPI0011CC094B|nr:NAD+ synthase [Salidesulfovibrio onnuriiensis]
MKIGILQLNPVVGDIQGNSRRILEAARKAASLGADFCITPELALTGYPPRDMLLYGGFIRKVEQAAAQLARDLEDSVPLLLGSVEINRSGAGKPVYNCAQWLEKGEVRQTFRKTLLPTYDVFDEARYFEPASENAEKNNLLKFKDKKFAVTICEDAWNDKDFWETQAYNRDPLEAAASLEPDAILNISASPFSLGKQNLRQRMLRAVAAKYAMPLIYVNQVGGNDDLVFDGRSCAFDGQGDVFYRAPGFEEHVDVLDLDDPAANPLAEDDLSEEAETWNALVLGVRDYVTKSGFRKVLLGLSGGIDSAITAAIAAKALGPENVLGVLMPSPYSSQGSIDDSLDLAEKTGIQTMTLPIEPIMHSFTDSLADAFQGYEPDTTEENIQSRIRGNLLMALSNKFRALLLTTGNKSELAVGYCTIYGDMSGGFAVISDVPKVLVFSLARWVNSQFGEIIPENIITKPPSAELRPDQKDEDSLPPYEILDAILEEHIERHRNEDELIAMGYEPEVVRQVLRLVTFAEFKRRQAAPGIKLKSRSFGTGWRMPLACKRNL